MGIAIGLAAGASDTITHPHMAVRGRGSSSEPQAAAGTVVLHPGQARAHQEER
ncbi:MAG TPA: hypothetical protein VHO01_16625 [Jatrophihabitans sp.]|nr:hypothetical protein [Jatrophihabitans sp.]